LNNLEAKAPKDKTKPELLKKGMMHLQLHRISFKSFFFVTLTEPADSFSEPVVSEEKEKPPTTKKGNMERPIFTLFHILYIKIKCIKYRPVMFLS